MEITATIYVYRNNDEDEIELTIVGDVEPYVPAKLSGHPDSWCPSEGGDVCVEAVLLDGKPWQGKLTAEETSEAERALEDAFKDHVDDQAEAAAEARAEDRAEIWFDDRADYIYNGY